MIFERGEWKGRWHSRQREVHHPRQVNMLGSHRWFGLAVTGEWGKVPEKSFQGWLTSRWKWASHRTCGHGIVQGLVWWRGQRTLGGSPNYVVWPGSLHGWPGISRVTLVAAPLLSPVQSSLRAALIHQEGVSSLSLLPAWHIVGNQQMSGPAPASFLSLDACRLCPIPTLGATVHTRPWQKVGRQAWAGPGGPWV